MTSSLSGTRSNQLSYKPGFARKGRGTLRRETLVRFNLSGKTRILLRKEVIQPLVPQRLPCYDFIPITTHTLGRQECRTSGADGFHDVTGGVYKARERIHGVVADTPLLANPTSRGRVADPDLNWGVLCAICSALRPCVALYTPL